VISTCRVYDRTVAHSSVGPDRRNAASYSRISAAPKGHPLVEQLQVLPELRGWIIIAFFFFVTTVSCSHLTKLMLTSGVSV
jgi:hypothetical protein